MRCALLLLALLASCSSAPKSYGVHLRVVAYNIKHGLGMDGAIDLERIAAVIRAQNPDVVTLQEVDRGCGRSGNVDQARVLGELCGMQHVFGEFMAYDGGQYGMALLSRYPILASTNHRLPPGTEPRSALEARIELPGGRTAIVTGIHLYNTEAERLAQARTLVATYARAELPVVLAGDFNSERGSSVMELLEQTFVNPAKHGPADTFPSDVPEREIDFMLVRAANGFVVHSLLVVDEPLASDHRPLVLELELE